MASASRLFYTACMTQSDMHPQPPLSPVASPLGMMAPAQIQSDHNRLADLSAIAAKLLEDPLQVRQLTERVYQLLQSDIRYQRERQGRYGGRL